MATFVLANATELRGGPPPEVTPSNASERPTARQFAEENLARPTGPRSQDVYGDPLPDGAVARLGTTRLRQAGHGWKRIAFLPKSSQFVVGGAGNPCRVWDARTGELIHRFDLAGAEMKAFCVSPADGAVATLSFMFRGNPRDMEMQLVVWNPQTWTERGRITWNDRLHVSQIAFSPDGKTIAMQQHDGVLRLCSLTDDNIVQRPSRVRGEVESLEFSPGGAQLATAGRQGVLLWDLKADNEPEKLSGLPQGAGVVRFSPNGKLLAVGCHDSLTRIFDVESRNVKLVIASVDRGHSTEGMQFSADGAQLIIPSRDNTVEFFDVQSGKRVRKLPSQNIGPAGVALSSEGDYLACIGGRAAMDVWSLKTGERISDRWSGHVDPPMHVHFVSNDRQLITAGSDGSINLWDAQTGRLVRSLHHENWVAALAMSPQGDLLLTCGLDDSVRLWDAATGKEKLRLAGHGKTGGSQTTSVAFSPEGTRFYSFGMDLILRAADTATGKLLAEHPIQPEGVEIEFGADGRPAGNDPFAEGAGGFQFDFAVLTPGAEHLVIGARSASRIYIFECETGQEAGSFTTDGMLQGFAVSPDGKNILTMEEDKPAAGADPNRRSRSILRVRDLTSKRTRREVVLPGRYSYRMAISSNGRLLAFATSKLDVKDFTRSYRLSVLDLQTLKQVAGKAAEWDSIRQLSFSRNGRLLAAAYADTPVLLWDLNELGLAEAGAP